MHRLPYRTELASNCVHLWICRPEEIRDEKLLADYNALLSPDETARKERFIFPEHRHQYLISRALVRTTLSRYADCPPECWQFSENEHGRPEIRIFGNIPPLRFNLSHTAGMAACAVVLKQPVGVDAENITRKINAMQIAKRYFTRPEIESLSELPETNQQTRFFQYWTLKESFSKAKGMGLTLGLDQYSLHETGSRDWHITCDPALKEDASRWRFWLLQPTPRHALAVSVLQPPAGRFELTSFETVPRLYTRRTAHEHVYGHVHE